jgi:hypothetical protein
MVKKHTYDNRINQEQWLEIAGDALPGNEKHLNPVVVQ